MALDGIFINKLVNELNNLIGLKINKVYHLSNDEFLFNLKGYLNTKLLISVNTTNYRIHTTNKSYTTASTPTSFVMFLRKHLEGGVIKSISQVSLDRIVIIKVLKNNELRDLEEKNIIIELVGKASNLIVTDSNFKIIDALKHVINIEQDKVIIPKSTYKIDITKKNIFEENDFKELYSKKELQETFYGISPLLYEAYINSSNKISFLTSLKNITIIPSIFKINSKTEFYFNNFFNNDSTIFNSLSELIDEFYFEKANTSIIKQFTNNLDTTIKKLIDRTKRKIENQNIELSAATNNETFKLYGELITANLYNLPKSSSEITVFNYYTNEDITIKLDSSFTVKENANKFFNKYQKMKKAIVHLEEQIILSNNELEYLELILMQINQATLSDIKEIKNELIANRYLAYKKIDKKKEKIVLTTFYTDEDTEIIVGKNNLQNEYITHKLAKFNELWFHVKDGAGSHVVVRKTDDFTEMDIRSAANLAAYYSVHKQSSSVEVVYTLVKNVKKIPGKKNCFVKFSNEKTIFIDPDINIINSLRTK